MKRVLIIGNPGAGKSTLATRIGHALDLPVIHLDKEFWQPGWIMTESETLRRRIKELANEDAWIMDGTYISSMDIRFPLADTIIFLDFPTGTCLWRIFRRIWVSYGQVRPDMAAGCPEKIDFEFVRWTWNFRKNIRPMVVKSLDEHFDGDNLFILRNQAEIDRFFERIGNSAQQ